MIVNLMVVLWHTHLIQAGNIFRLLASISLLAPLLPLSACVCCVCCGGRCVCGVRWCGCACADVLVDGVDALVGEHAAAADALATATAAVGAAHWDC